jgi:serine O-acetyltransferase
MYDTKLPDIFLIFHGVGTMLGKATYNDFFVALQGCTIGMNRGKYPIMDKGVALTAHASLIGNCNVGKLVTISSYTSVIDKNIETSNVVFKNNNGELVCKPSVNSYAQSFFNIEIK